MNTKLLKQKILDLAIRGKLTQQLKSDGTALDLLKQISEQKRESSSTLSSPRRRGSSSAQSEKTIIPLDKNEAPFEIPANWEWVRLGDVCDDIFAGGDKPLVCTKEKTESNLIPVYANGIENDGLYGFTNVARVTKKAITISARGTIGFSCVRELPFVPIVRLLTVIPFYHLVDLKYLKAVFDILLNVGEGSSIPQLTVPTIRIFVFPLPPLAEQQRIVEKIQEAFAEIDSIENNKELLKTHIKQARQKILDLAIHGKLVLQNKADEPASVLLERITRDNPHYEKIENEPFEIPENWAWVRINDIASDMADGPFGSNLKAEHYTDKKEARIIQLSNIAENGWKDENVRYTTFEHAKKNISRSIVEAGNLVIAKMMPAGRAMICPSTEKMYVLSSDAVKLVPIDEINNQFLCYAINSPYFKAQVNGNIQGTTRLRTSISKLRECLLALPPLAEQSRIVAKIEELFSTLDQMERNVV